MKWIAFRRQGKLPPERRSVLVQIPARQSESCKQALIDYPDPNVDPNFCDTAPTVAVGYLRIHSSGPFWVVPGVGGPVTHWCDCLGDDFTAPEIHMKQVIGAPRRQWFKP